MNEPNMKDFDRWKSDPVALWFFGQFDLNGDLITKGFLQNQADLRAQDNGRAAGLAETESYDHMKTVREAGFIFGMESAIDIDPFENEREEVVDEDKGDR